jgi:hypothetical protein
MQRVNGLQLQVILGFHMEQIVFRSALLADVPAVVAMLADDELGSKREITGLPLDERYVAAFRAIESDVNQQLVVVVDGDEVIGTLQLSFIPGIARMGAWRGQIEAVRIAAHRRDSGLGLQSRPAHYRQEPRRRTPLLREARFRGESRRLQACFVTPRKAGPSCDARGCAVRSTRSITCTIVRAAWLRHVSDAGL